MSSGPIYWPSYPGEMLEAVMAVLVAQDRPDVLRRTPSSGDGGVDLVIPSATGYQIQQIKGFGQRIGSSEQRQIRSSFDELCTDPRLDRPVTSWYLVVPVDPTSGEQTWFNEMTSNAPFPCFWLGKVHWDSMAARHPHVLDYYFNGGRDRITQRYRAIVAGTVDPSRELRAVDVAESIGVQVTQLSREDPHYSYDVFVSDEPLDASQSGRYAMLSTMRFAGGQCVTIGVRAKHRYADRDSPIGGTVSIAVDESQREEFRDAWAGFVRFGRALDIPEGALNADISAPSGLGETVHGGGGRIGAATVENPPDDWRVVAATEDNSVLAELPLRTKTLTRGYAGGAELTLADESEMLTVVLTLLPPNDGTGEEGISQLSMSTKGFAGEPVLKILPVARVAASTVFPNQLQLRERYGQRIWTSVDVEAGEPLLSSNMLRHLEDLAVLQRMAPCTITVSEEVTAEFATSLRRNTRLLEGEVLTGTWDTITLAVAEGLDPSQMAAELAGSGPFACTEERFVTFGDTTIMLGPFTTTLADAHLADPAVVDGGIRLVPGADSSFTERAGGVS